jgi:hypothetical protein
LEQLRRENQRALLSRRQQLAELYNNEMQGWENEVLSRVETLEDRKARYVVLSLESGIFSIYNFPEIE